jgi:hypothetical protein
MYNQATLRSEPKARRPISPAKDVQGDFAQFTDLMRRVVAVPHSKIKAKLDAEKEAKRKFKSLSASRDSVS